MILDVMLPGMDGFDVLKQIRKTSDVPVLMLTARGDEADRIVGKLRVDPNTRTAKLDAQPLTLTPVEYDLQASLARARGRVKSREQLLEECRDRNYDVFDRSIDVHISALRKKPGDDPKEPRYIKTVRSEGYMYIRPEDE